jgi:hypothetical protein
LIGETGHPDRHLAISGPPRRTTMLKTISAALLAISVLAAPAIAADAVKTTPATTAAKTTQAPVIKSVKAKPSVLNANARMGRHHHRFHRYHRHHRFHRHHRHMGAAKAHQFSKVSVKHVTPALKRG